MTQRYDVSIGDKLEVRIGMDWYLGVLVKRGTTYAHVEVPHDATIRGGVYQRRWASDWLRLPSRTEGGRA